MTRIAAKPTMYGNGDAPCSRVSSSIVLPIAAIHGAAMTLYQIAPSTKNTIDAIQTATCLAPLTAILLQDEGGISPQLARCFATRYANRSLWRPSPRDGAGGRNRDVSRPV